MSIMDSTLQELNDFFKEFEETKICNKKQSEFIALLQEEIQFARDEEKEANSRRARCESFLNTQQEIIHKLLAVKEENENLKCKLKQTELSLSMVQNNSIEEQMRKDAKMQELEQDYLKKIKMIQEEANQQAEKEKSGLLLTNSELKSSNSKLEEALLEKDAEIFSLQEQVENLKALSDANIEAFHKKLAEQERKHQSEIDTWKEAELNRSLYEQNQLNNPVSLYGSSQNQYQPSQGLRPVQAYQPNSRFQEQTSGYQKAPLVTHYKNAFQQRQITNMVRPLATFENYQNKSDFISTSDLYMQGRLANTSQNDNGEINDEKNTKEKKQVLTQKSNILMPNKRRKLFTNDPNLL